MTAPEDSEPQISELEIHRRTEALKLNVLYPDFPLELCFK
jgi:hypothetical protein